jgi:RND superfamily putative drug exporter
VASDSVTADDRAFRETVLAAAGLPLLLAILGLVAAGGSLWLAAQLAGVTIWAMNFALMFALAVGIDYALFVVVRFRAFLRRGLAPREAVAAAMDAAGKAVLVSGLAVGFVLAASLTLLPAVLARFGSRVDRLALPLRGGLEHRREGFARLARLGWRRPLAVGVPALVTLLALAAPALRLETAMPSVAVVPEGSGSRAGFERLQRAFGPGAPYGLQVVARAGSAPAARIALARLPGLAEVAPAEVRDGLALLRAVPAARTDAGATIEAARRTLPPGALVGGAAAESHDLERALDTYTPLVYAAVLGVGFLVLVLVLRAPVLSAAAVLLNLLATAAAFGVATLVFQDGRLEGLLGFESQGFVDAWAPIFFFALIFALAMDYTVFLLAVVKEGYERMRDPREAAVEGLASSGRVINAAAAVMVVVFFTFALSGPLPPKEMGVILGVAVLLDSTLVRLLLLPAVLRLLGSTAWWAPRWVDRLLPEVRFGH